MTLSDKILLRKRSVIETVNDELKNICQVEHSRHRSFGNFRSNMIAGLLHIASCLKNHKSNSKLKIPTKFAYFNNRTQVNNIYFRYRHFFS